MYPSNTQPPHRIVWTEEAFPCVLSRGFLFMSRENHLKGAVCLFDGNYKKYISHIVWLIGLLLWLSSLRFNTSGFFPPWFLWWNDNSFVQSGIDHPFQIVKWGRKKGLGFPSFLSTLAHFSGTVTFILINGPIKPVKDNPGNQEMSSLPPETALTALSLPLLPLHSNEPFHI